MDFRKPTVTALVCLAVALPAGGDTLILTNPTVSSGAGVAKVVWQRAK